MKKYLKMSSAAVVIDALRVNSILFLGRWILEAKIPKTTSSVGEV